VLNSDLDAKTLAYLNMFAILGALENLTELDPQARALLTNPKPITLAFAVRGGPKGTLSFSNGKVRVTPGAEKGASVLIPLAGPAQFNKVIDGAATPIPVKGFRYVQFLTKDFDALTKRLEETLRPAPEALEDPAFFARSTEIMLYVIAVAIAQVGDYDEIGKFSAAHIPDGDIAFNIKGGPCATIHVRDHILSAEKAPAKSPRAVMEFDSMQTARALFDGKINALACIGNGTIAMRGMINMIDNLNRLLDRVALYLG
jgi:hypothetical protein